VNRHSNKLRPGHLHGNRFRILIRHEPNSSGAHASGSSIDARQVMAPIVERLQAMGLPNYYGPQRFGKDAETVHVGLALLRDEPPPVSATGQRPNVKSPFLRKLALSAVQSALFNTYLAQRIADCLFRQVVRGDVMAKWPAGGMFVAEDVAAEQRRFDAREIVTAGPIFGKKTFAAQYAAAEREAAILRDAGLGQEVFRQFGKLMAGTRRHNLVYVDDLSFDMEAEGVRLNFTLPAGSYATVLLREIMKTDCWEE
jgi:tRNA pseudouridine13 synthase